jgi:hypothetical protein
MRIASEGHISMPSWAIGTFRADGYSATQQRDWSKAMTGTELIAAERQRQMDVEGWTPEHDDEHNEFQLANAAEAYLVAYTNELNKTESIPYSWPWDSSWWKPSSDPIRNLVKAGALIAAEIDRLQRLEQSND